MRRIIIVLIVSIFVVSAYAQVEEVSTYKQNEFGAHAGFSTGLGLSYRHWFSNYGIQTTLIPVRNDGRFFGSLGVTGLYSLKRVGSVHTFLYWGNHLIYQSHYESSSYDEHGYYVYEDQGPHVQYNMGFGPGFSFGRVVNFSLMVGYGIYDLTDRFNLLPTGEIGVYYMF